MKLVKKIIHEFDKNIEYEILFKIFTLNFILK